MHWSGEKEIICHQKNLGLKEHVFFCGELSSKYGSVIVLEDDLYVSPAYYAYAQIALKSCDSTQIAGIALYNNSLDEAASLPFQPLKGQDDYYLMQVPCSWGQAWSRKQWMDFKKWFISDYDKEQLNHLPKAIQLWSEHSWKKPYFAYLKSTDKFFVYPYWSYSMNLNELGTNVNSKSFKFLNSLSLNSTLIDFNFESTPKYDSAYMVMSDYLNSMTKTLKEYDYEVDFYGTKLNSFCDEQWIITTLPTSQHVKSFGLELMPIELNVILEIEGNELFLTQKRHIYSNKIRNTIIKYFYPVPKWYYPYFQLPILKRLFGTFAYSFKKLFGQ
ncbi:MAG: hypothetical protein AAF688_06790 [Bacteroidota bacterium]